MPETENKLAEGFNSIHDDLAVEDASVAQYTESAAVQYTSHPIAKFKIGRFQFTNGVLTLTDDEDVEEFEKLLNDKNLPAIDRARIQKIDVKRAEEIVHARLANERKISSVMDSSSGDPHRNAAKIGTGDLQAGQEGEIGKTNLADADLLPPAVGQGSEGQTNSTTTQDAAVLVTGTGVTDPNHAGTDAGGTGDAQSGENRGFVNNNPEAAGAGRDNPTAAAKGVLGLGLNKK